MYSVAADNLSKTFGHRRAVDGISFTVAKGEIFGFLGSNGAGKSTTMRMIACRSPLTGGRLTVENLDVRTDEKKIRSIIGVVPQENNLDPDLNVTENLFVYASYFRLGKSETAARVAELLKLIRLEDRADARVDELSGGMKRRLIIARALLHRPQILLLDEPTTGLDPNVRQEIWEKLEELRRTENLTILLSTHYMDEAEKLCQRLLFLSKGKIVAEGEPSRLIERETGGRYVLEIRETASLPLQNAPDGVRAAARGTNHLYFAENPDQLAGLMNFYGSRQMFLRPANLEDVFLQLATDEES